VREPRKPEFRDLDAVTALTFATELTEMDVFVATRARRRRQLEANVQDGRTRRTSRWPIGRDMALTAGQGGVLSAEEFREARVLERRDGKARRRVARLACGAELALMDVCVTTDARYPQPAKIGDSCRPAPRRNRCRFVAGGAGQPRVFADEWKFRPGVIEGCLRKPVF